MLEYLELCPYPPLWSLHKTKMRVNLYAAHTKEKKRKQVKFLRQSLGLFTTESHHKEAFTFFPESLIAPTSLFQFISQLWVLSLILAQYPHSSSLLVRLAPAFWLPAPISKLKSMEPISTFPTSHFNFG